MPTVVDHLFVLLLAVGVPIEAVASIRWLRREVAKDELGARMRWYARTIIWEWSAAAVLVAWWGFAGRSPGTLGFSWPSGTGFAVCLGLTLGAIALLAAQARSARRDPASVVRALDGLDAIRGFLPHTEAELRRFYKVGVTAGIVEELIYRGFVMWYVASYAPVWLAIAASAVLFGAGHLYQGVNGAIRVVALGLVAGALYWGSGSIWLPMVLHAALDVVQGRMIFLALRESQSATG